MSRDMTRLDLAELRAIVADEPYPDRDLIEADLTRLHSVLDEAAADSTLPDRPTAEAPLHDLIVRTRLAP